MGGVPSFPSLIEWLESPGAGQAGQEKGWAGGERAGVGSPEEQVEKGKLLINKHGGCTPVVVAAMPRVGSLHPCCCPGEHFCGEIL